MWRYEPSLVGQSRKGCVMAPQRTQGESISTSAPLLAELGHLLLQEVEAYEHLLALHQDVRCCLAALVLDPLLASLQAREHVARHIAHVEH